VRETVAANVAAPLDTVRRVATPEGCELNLRLAGPVVRSLAWLADFLIRLVIFIAAAMLLARFGKMGWGMAMLIGFLLEWLYPVVFEVLWRGATPGKKIAKLVVLHDDGTPVGWGAAFARNTLRFVDFLPLGYACGLATMWLNRDGKRLGDLLAGTVVVYASEVPRPTVSDSYFEVEPPPFPLNLAEQRALLEYRQRAPLLTEARADELAGLALPLTQGLAPEAARQRLFRIANTLLGRRGERVDPALAPRQGAASP
jgi:uncharacterized RDD family membrane protein YckC